MPRRKTRKHRLRPAQKRKKDAEKRLEKDFTRAVAHSRAGFGQVLRGYEPPQECFAICDAMIRGVVRHDDVCEEAGVSEERYAEVMKRPENLAWVANTMIQEIQNLFGLLDWEMYVKAKNGSIPAYNALMNRFGKAAEKKSLHLHGKFNMREENFDALTNDQLEKQIEHYERKQGSGIIYQGGPGDVPEASEGEGEEDPASASPGLQTPPGPDGVPRGGEDLPPEDSPDGEPLG